MTPASHTRRPPGSLPQQAGQTQRTAARPPARRGQGWWLAWIVLAAALVALGSVVGLWYLPFAAGVLLGAATRLGRLGLAVSLAGLLLLGPVAWGVVLGAESLSGAAVGATARAAAAIAGLPALAAATIASTLLIALVQAAAGLWLGRALTPRSAWRGRRAGKEPEVPGMP
jgi:hypothetical protein